MAHDTSAHSHLFITSSVNPFSSMSKRIREHVADNQQISAKSKPIRVMMKQEQDPTDATESRAGEAKNWTRGCGATRSVRETTYWKIQRPYKSFSTKDRRPEMVQKLMLSTKYVCHKEASQQSLTIAIGSKFFCDFMWAALVLSESHDKFQRMAMDHSGPRTQVLVEAV